MVDLYKTNTIAFTIQSLVKRGEVLLSGTNIGRVGLFVYVIFIPADPLFCLVEV